MDSSSPKVKLEDAVVKNDFGVYVIKTEKSSDFSEMDWCIGNENPVVDNNNVFYEPMLDDIIDNGCGLRFVFKCNYCSEAMESENDVYRHNLIHAIVFLNRVYQCNYCQDNFVTKTLLKSHIHSAHAKCILPIVHGKKTHVCHICFKKFFSNSNLHDHMTNVHSKQKLKCKKCKMNYKNKRSYQRHPCLNDRKCNKKPKEPKHEEKLIRCEDCPKVFSHKTQLTLHLKNVHNIIVRNGEKMLSPNRLDCEQCGTVFKSVEYLRTHLRRVHYDDGKKHMCYKCDKDYKSPRYLRIHKQNVHTKKKRLMTQDVPQQCEKCSKVIKTTRNFKKHVEKCIKTEKFIKTDENIKHETQTSTETWQQCEKCLEVIKTQKEFQNHIQNCIKTENNS